MTGRLTPADEELVARLADRLAQFHAGLASAEKWELELLVWNSLSSIDRLAMSDSAPQLSEAEENLVQWLNEEHSP